ncbi:MAG: hypothetical protein DELT_02229 [Desulfovibrio sp.]
MPKPTTIRLDKVTMERVDKLADVLERSRAWVIKEAVTQYLEREEKHLRGIQKGVGEAQQGFVFAEQEILKHFARKGLKNVGS